jgi:glycosyltransferase involved in cell wall biosynthesis
MIDSPSPRVTVVTPVFNGARFITRTLESIRSQTYPNIEHIVIDGGSTDDSMTIVERFADKIAYAVSEPDRGMYDAINKGFAKATGSIYCYLNSDDVYAPNAIEMAVSAMQREQADLCMGNCIFIDENDHELSRYKGVPLNFEQARELCRIPFTQQTAFWTRQLHEAVGGFDANMRYVADTKFFYEALRLSGRAPAYVDLYVASFRQHNDGFSTKAALAMEQEHRQVLAHIGAVPGPRRLAQELRMKWINRHNLLRGLARRWR